MFTGANANGNQILEVGFRPLPKPLFSAGSALSLPANPCDSGHFPAGLLDEIYDVPAALLHLLPILPFDMDLIHREA